MRMARKHLGWYSKGLPASAEFRAAVNRETEAAKVRACWPRSSCRPSRGRRLAWPCGPLNRVSALSEQFPRASSIRCRKRSSWSMATGVIHYANLSAEQFFGVGRARLVGHPLDRVRARGHAALLAARAGAGDRRRGRRERRDLESPRIGNRFCAPAPVADRRERRLVAVRWPSSRSRRSIDRQMSNRSAARSVSALAAMLAHEIKNPLAGIRGAAQLLEVGAKAEDAPLAQLIVDETDRVAALVDRMEAFSDGLPSCAAPINIHQVLTGCGAGRQRRRQGVRCVEGYDPSLPAVLGDEDQLIQVFLNLVKNAAEAHAAATARGEIGCPPPTATACVSRVPRPAGAGRAAGGAVRTTARACRPHLREHLFQPSSPPRPTARASAWRWSPSWSPPTAACSISSPNPAGRCSGCCCPCERRRRTNRMNAASRRS